MRPRKWNEEQLRSAAAGSTSVRQILGKLGLVEAGGNYSQMKKYLELYKIDTSHMTGRGWSRGRKCPRRPILSLEEILVKGSYYNSHRLKKRLIRAKIKPAYCELCSWAKRSDDGRLPLELDHINGERTDNRIKNLRILCPNCHSLQPTHRGLNKKAG